MKACSIPDDDVFGLRIAGGHLRQKVPREVQVDRGHETKLRPASDHLQRAVHIAPLVFLLRTLDDPDAAQTPATAREAVQALAPNPRA